MDGELQYHIRCAPGQVARYVLIPGDPGRVPKIAGLWEEAQEIAHHREFRTYTGRFRGFPITSTSSGIGCPSLAIAVEELARIGADTFIRVGTTGAIQADIGVGDIIISSGAVRLDGTSKQYVRVEYPAVADYEVVVALVQAAENLGYRYHVGITASADSFYVGEGRPGFRGYTQSSIGDILQDLGNANVLNFEMESSALFTLSNLYGLRAGAVCAVVANRLTGEWVVGAGEVECIGVANEAVRLLAEMDAAKDEHGKEHWYPGINISR
jgi:uridine phosphorylase